MVKRKDRYLKGGKVPSGLVPRILKSGLFSMKIVDDRDRPNGNTQITFTPPPKINSEADYSFQEDAVLEAVTYGRGLLDCPTGAGKTVIMAKIINRLRVPSLVIVPSLELLNQTYNKFVEYFGDGSVGIFGEGKKEGFKFPIVVATQQSLYITMKTDRELFNSLVCQIELLLTDECHHINTGKKKSKGKKKEKVELPANSWWHVSMAIEAYYRFGVSATIEVSDSPNGKFVLESATGRVIYSISTSELIKRKVLCPIIYNVVKLPAEPCRSWRNIYAGKKGNRHCVVPGAYEINILENPERNSLISDITMALHKQGRKVLVLVDLVEKHGKILEKMIQNSVFLHGEQNRTTRDEHIESFVEDNKVLISTIVKEGFDVPAIDAVWIAGGGKGHRQLIQKIGRARRVYPGKINAVVWDIYDDDGMTKDGSPRMCARHSEERLSIYLSVPEDRVNFYSVDNTGKIVLEQA